MVKNVFRLCLVTASLISPVLIVVYIIQNHVSWESADNSNVTNGSRATPTLKFLVVLSRHGNRGPLVSYPSFPYTRNDTTYWPYGVGQLTKLGRMQLYNMGAEIRALYNGFLAQDYFQSDFVAYSTVMDRTLMSAQSSLAGLFPPREFQVWNSQIAWQPLPVYPNYLDHTPLISAPALCPRFQTAQNESDTVFEHDYGSNMTAVLNYLQTYTGVSPTPGHNIPNLAVFWESFFTSDQEGLVLPSWSRKVYPEPMTSLMTKLFVSKVIATDTMIRLFQGEIFQAIVNLMQTKVNGTMNPDRKMYYYSGHDGTIIGLKGILGLASDIGMVKSGSALIIELHQDTQSNNYHVQILYKDGDASPTPVNIPGCGNPCDFSQLMIMTQKYYNITDYQKECQTNYTLYDS